MDWGLTPRKRWGIGMVASGLILLLVGGFALGADTDPAWLEPVVETIGAILELLGFVWVYPGRTKSEIAAAGYHLARGPPD